VTGLIGLVLDFVRSILGGTRGIWDGTPEPSEASA
jgi:hypothetical protein